MKADTAFEVLRSARLRPTTARIAILQVLADSGHRALSIEDAYRALTLRGVLTSIGTIYKTMQELNARELLLREWGDFRKAMYRLKPEGFNGDRKRIRLACHSSGRMVLIGDADLYARLLQAARDAGFNIEGQMLSIEVDFLKTFATDADGPLRRVHPRLVARRG